MNVAPPTEKTHSPGGSWASPPGTSPEDAEGSLEGTGEEGNDAVGSVVAGSGCDVGETDCGHAVPISPTDEEKSGCGPGAESVNCAWNQKVPAGPPTGPDAPAGQPLQPRRRKAE